MVFTIEAILICVLFTAAVFLKLRGNLLDGIGDYPPAVGEWARKQGLISAQRKIRDQKFYVGKLVRGITAGIILGLMMAFVNGAENFSEAFCTIYGLWLVGDAYDLLIIDWILCTHCELTRIPGSEKMPELYRDYSFHGKMSLRGLWIGIPVAAIGGVVCRILTY